MSISCSCHDFHDYEWWYYPPHQTSDFEPLNTTRSKRCCSCKKLIRINELCIRVPRARTIHSDIEERIYGDEVPLAPWYLCEECGGLALALAELNLCYDLGTTSLKEQIREWKDGM